MNQVPMTFVFDFAAVSDTARPFIMHEFKSCGAEHLVLTSTLIANILQKPQLAETLMKEMADNGLTFVDAHAPYGTLIDMICPVPELRKQLVLRHCLAIRIAASMGVDTIAIHVGESHSWPELSYEQGRDNIIDTLEKILPTAEECGVTVCIENIWFRCATPNALLEIRDRVPSNHLGFCYDSGHANVLDKARHHPHCATWISWEKLGLEPEWEDRALEKMLPHIVNCHLHDNDGTCDQHRCPGYGNVDWQRTMKLLRQAPRLKNIQSEVIPVRVNDSIAEICRKFRELSEIQ